MAGAGETDVVVSESRILKTTISSDEGLAKALFSADAATSSKIVRAAGFAFQQDAKDVIRALGSTRVHRPRTSVKFFVSPSGQWGELAIAPKDSTEVKEAKASSMAAKMYGVMQEAMVNGPASVTQVKTGDSYTGALTVEVYADMEDEVRRAMENEDIFVLLDEIPRRLP